MQQYLVRELSFFIIELVSREKRDIYLTYYNTIFKDRVLQYINRLGQALKLTSLQLKNIILFKFSLKVCKIKVKKRNLMLRYFNSEPSFKLRWCRARDLFG